MFNTENQNNIERDLRQAKSVKYHYHPGKEYAMAKYKGNANTFKGKNIRETQFCHSSGRVSDNLMDKLMGPDK